MGLGGFRPTSPTHSPYHQIVLITQRAANKTPPTIALFNALNNISLKSIYAPGGRMVCHDVACS